MQISTSCCQRDHLSSASARARQFLGPSAASAARALPASPPPAPPGHRQPVPGTASPSIASASRAPPASPPPAPPGHCQPIHHQRIHSQPLHRHHHPGTTSLSTASASGAPPASPPPAPTGHRQPLHRQHLPGTASFSTASAAWAPPASPPPAPPGHCQLLHRQPLPHRSPAGSQMAHNVTYADLRFVRTPAGSSPSSRAPEAAPDAEEDAELTYENIHLGQTVEVKRGPGAEQSHEPWWGTRHLPLGLLGACLFLLASTIGLGVRYWQVSQHLQQASQAHEAESSRLSQQVSSKGASLAQTASELELAQRELEEARRDLEQERLEGNRTQKRLQQLEAELDGTTKTLATLTQEKQEVTENLSRVKQELSSIRPCEQTDCCPEKWLLYKGKCLFVSREKKSWEESRTDCERRSGHLLITKPWDWMTMPSFLQNTYVDYWIGLKGTWQIQKWGWYWVDNSSSEMVPDYDMKDNGPCAKINGGTIKRSKCSLSKGWICERRAARPGTASEPFPYLS